MWERRLSVNLSFHCWSSSRVICMKLSRVPGTMIFTLKRISSIIEYLEERFPLESLRCTWERWESIGHGPTQLPFSSHDSLELNYQHRWRAYTYTYMYTCLNNRNYLRSRTGPIIPTSSLPLYTFNNTTKKGTISR